MATVIQPLRALLRKAHLPLHRGGLERKGPLLGSCEATPGACLRQKTEGLFPLQPFRHGCAAPPPLTQGRLTLKSPPCAKGGVSAMRRQGDCFFTALPSRLRRATSPYTGEAYVEKSPLCKGGCLRYAETGGLFLYSPSVMTRRAIIPYKGEVLGL